MITFTLIGYENTVFQYVKQEQGFVYGKRMVDGKTGRGRPSKFPVDQVQTSEPIPNEVQLELEVSVVPEDVVMVDDVPQTPEGLVVLD